MSDFSDPVAARRPSKTVRRRLRPQTLRFGPQTRHQVPRHHSSQVRSNGPSALHHPSSEAIRCEDWRWPARPQAAGSARCPRRCHGSRFEYKTPDGPDRQRNRADRPACVVVTRLASVVFNPRAGLIGSPLEAIGQKPLAVRTWCRRWTAVRIRQP